MAVIEPGRIVMKIAGREGGCYAVVLEIPKDSFVLITGPKSITGIKRRKCSIFHLEPTEHMLQAGTDEQLERAWKSSGLIEKLGIIVPQKRKQATETKPRPKSVRKARAKPEKKQKSLK